LVLFAYVGRHF